MNITYRFIEILKEKQGFNSDYAVAKFIGVKPQKVSNWKAEQSEASGVNLLKIIVGAGISAEDALKIMTKEAEEALPASNNSATDCITN